MASTSYALGAAATNHGLGQSSSEGGERRKKKPYKELTLEEKVQLIRLAEENAGMSQASIAERYAIAKSNVCRILQRKHEYIRAFESAGFAGSRKRKLRSDDPTTADGGGGSGVARPLPRPAVVVDHRHHFGNETLRAHMYKQHQISRMFMCRCCNWAFPDKTSLHMHMQAKEEGKNINVPVIGKGGAQGSGNQLHQPQPQNAFSPLQLHALAALPPHQPLSIADPSAAGNIFPLSMVQQRDELMNKLRERFMLNTMVAQSGFNLAAWLANFPKVDASGVGRLGGSLNLRPEPSEDQKSEEGEVDMKMNDSPVIVEVNESGESGGEADDDHVNISDDIDQPISNNNDDDTKADGLERLIISTVNVLFSPPHGSSCSEGDSPGQHMPALRSAINASPLNSLMYKKRLLDSNTRRKNLQEALLNIAEHASSAGVPAGQAGDVRDANHVSPSETHSSASPPSEPGNCYECSVFKGKLAVSENRCRYLEGRTATLQTDALRFSTRVSVSENNARQFEQETRIVREQNEMLQRKLLECQEKTLAFMQGSTESTNNPKALASFLNDILQTTFFR